MHYLLILNPCSGTKGGPQHLDTLLTESFTARGHTAEVYTTTCAGDGYKRAKQAVENREPFDVVVAVGGDGTVNEVARALIASPYPLGILPNGSGNGLARELNIPMSLSQATEVLLEHHIEVMDTCEANGHSFFTTCGIGFDGTVSEEFAKSETRGPLTYIRDTLQLYREHQVTDYTITLDDGESHTTRAFLVAIANASQYGNNAFIAPHAKINDGWLDVTVIKEFPLTKSGQLAIQLFSKGIDKNEYTRSYRARQISITASKPTPYHTDGEPLPATNHLQISILPHSLKVIIGEPNPTGQEFTAFINRITNGFFEWRSDLVESVRKSLKDLSSPSH